MHASVDRQSNKVKREHIFLVCFFFFWKLRNKMVSNFNEKMIKSEERETNEEGKDKIKD